MTAPTEIDSAIVRDRTLRYRSVAALPTRLMLLVALWLWAIWSCAEHWLGNPNYSYGWIVGPLAAAFALRRWLVQDDDSRTKRATMIAPGTVAFLFSVALVAVGTLEFSREEVWHPQFVLWTICALAIAASLYLTAWNRAVVFPACFFLTAVPWPPRFEQPLTSFLMRAVANGTAEALHWLGVEAETSGAAIALHGGLVGITEACSGIRSLQSGIMFGLAIGEWFLLRASRRLVLLLIAIGLALLTNLARTLALSLQAEWHGLESVEAVHDLIGNVVVTAMIVAIWTAGKLLAPRNKSAPASLAVMRARLHELTQRALAPGSTVTRGILLAGATGFAAARICSARLDAAANAQTTAFFRAQTAPTSGNENVPIPRDIWNELRPTSGEYVRRRDKLAAGVEGACYHFFWKPSPWNRYALVHRPDICMPGIGWAMSGSPAPISVTLGGQTLRFHAFRFDRGQQHALELWGVWRNGEPVSLDYQPAQVFGSALPPPTMQWDGKRRSATEIVACSIVTEGAPPDEQVAKVLLQSAFGYVKP